MKPENFEYLRPYLSSPEDTEGGAKNWFCPLTEAEIKEAEKKLGFCFPDQLRNFYQKIGYGSLKVPYNPPADYEFYGDNYINPPSIIADIMLLGHDSGYISEEFLDYLPLDAMPFFHIADSSDFLYMKPKSGNPNAVYAFGNELVEKEFNRFIWRLYFESPDFYAHI